MVFHEFGSSLFYENIYDVAHFFKNDWTVWLNSWGLCMFTAWPASISAISKLGMFVSAQTFDSENRFS
tara:strand:- start:98 stop:301 length:204 start_codon:yes stop_codon:yes gene_type:complete